MDRRTFNRRLIAGGAVAAASLPVAPLVSSAAGADASAADGPVRTAPAGGQVKHLRLYAEKLPDGQMGYGLEKGAATVPGPLIELNEGDTLHVAFENTMDVPVSLHVHGLDYEITNDGTRHTGSDVEPGGTRTYTWRTHAPGRREDGTWRAGSAGYWHYHDHVVGTEHGTGGIRKGLYGPVIVRRKGDVLPDRTYTIVFNDMLINNRPAHGGPDFEAITGDRVEFVMITHGEYYHTFHLHGHRWADNRTGLLTGPDDPSRVIDNKIVGPADSFGFQVIAGEGVGAGAWMYHCHVQSHSDMGMVGLFLVKKPDGTIPGYEPHDHGGHG
ncbi:multicopper oxidase domain-containing protein [Streptomyces longwoodensis]|uniref:multicopper oxidase domain-containing protein n=1 Tax=Streptomyces longwoodensis TaxID=68231 RepID=UPI002E81F963|nr:multicopper oxidase domain-containing protein [Streptomyces longwoodensis]WUC56785.1 multicopper oxidase domain-containing protein [Streptomyces longwoodensis]WUC70307.1 multicopper oxidase domain-containing protein [Streptomyces longwoodensis]